VTALYSLYESQADELNDLTRRIKGVVKAIKARGIYDPALGADLGKLFELDDNELVPAENAASLATEKGIANAIWYAPIETLISTLSQLYQSREQCKQVIYEITGISDILRGATKASETFGAQELKAKYGSLRLSRMQRAVQEYARSLIRMMLEVAATKFDEEAWATMTSLPYPSSQEAAQLQKIAMAAQQTGQPLDPQTQARLQQPSWGQVLALLQHDPMRSYRIDIEMNSTLEPDAAEDQKHINELMAAMGQFLNGVGPLVMKGIMPFEVARSMLLTIARRYQFGREIEEDIQQMKAPKPEEDAAQTQLHAQVGQAESKMKAMEAQRKIEQEYAKLEILQLTLKYEQETLTTERALLSEAKTMPGIKDVLLRQLQGMQDEMGQQLLAHQQTMQESHAEQNRVLQAMLMQVVNSANMQM
jgi:hypothetical protein